jgi:3-oxo-5-alpha-steroid 4-dehydrogenase 3
MSWHFEASLELSLLAAALLFLQVARRLYECMFVAVFSDSKMNLGHYLVGYLHYWGCATVILSYSADFSKTEGGHF